MFGLHPEVCGDDGGAAAAVAQVGRQGGQGERGGEVQHLEDEVDDGNTSR